LTAGMTVAPSKTNCRSSTPKFDTPIDLTKPSFCSCSIPFHSSFNVPSWFAGLGLCIRNKSTYSNPSFFNDSISDDFTVWPGLRTRSFVTTYSSERGFPEALIPAPRDSSLLYTCAPSRCVIPLLMATRTKSAASRP